MIRAKARLLTVLLPMVAGACSTAGNYPSLALRDVERIRGSAQPVAGEAPQPAPEPPPLSADLATRLNGLVKMAREADRQFQANRPAAERAVASAGGIASDSWSTASIALARLETSRSSAMVALADLDGLYVDARTDAPLEETPSAEAIASARDLVDGWVDAQDEVLSSLAARLPG
ncbi:hypothetical protein [Novosphingobium malaysiense]|uniref:Lipoprotein n=1 Tax=Novosphingobium malaysiense TaxID=1348853 RepID=A0A0B1ZK88_9SPHN|nr:hypothetical protein [Novosphingobium malaysiense]KHK89683.1 hypothetical protein LK12_19750 [Novosphingobium malaysiense]